jgi:hypothetical protein
MKSHESLGGSVENKITEESLLKGKEFIARIEEHLNGLAQSVEGQPITDSGNVRFMPRDNESLYFINRGVASNKTMGVDIDGNIHTIAYGDGAIGSLAEIKNVVSVDHIDVPISGRMLPAISAEITSVPNRDNDISAYDRCVATFYVYHVLDIRVHDLALIQEN